jgi:hypothetical protein
VAPANTGIPRADVAVRVPGDERFRDVVPGQVLCEDNSGSCSWRSGAQEDMTSGGAVGGALFQGVDAFADGVQEAVELAFEFLEGLEGIDVRFAHLGAS